MLEEKASQIEQRLELYEESKYPDEAAYSTTPSTLNMMMSHSSENQLVPYMNQQDNMKLSDALKTLKQDEDGIESLSDVDDAEID